MAKNDFKAFAIGENANTLSQEEYESSDFIEEGFKSGIARSERLNKVWRQSSVIAAVIGKYIAEKTGEDVMDDGDLEKLVAQLDLALKHKITTEIPAASLTQKGISQLNSATNSDREDQAATPKAVHDVRKIAESKLSGVSDASLTQKGIVQLSSATNSTNETLAATPKAIKEAYDFANTANVAAKNAHDEANRATDNANSRLAKNQNGADIPNKSEFIKNLGLTETVSLAKSAVPSSRKINGKALSGDVSLNAGDVGAVSATGGNYQGTFNFSEIATIAKERNSVQLISTNAGAPAGTLCSYMKANWYGNEIAVGAVRGGTVDLIGAGIDINSKRALTIYKNGIVVPADYGNFDARYDNIPVGVPLPYPHRYTPVGYLTCNGQSFDKSLYPKLAEAYPNGRVPDLRGEFIRGWDDSRGVDPGRVCGTWQPDAMQGHTHRAWPNATAASATDSPSQHGGPEYTGRITQTHVVSSPVSDGVNGEPRTANETRPRNIAFNYIVRAA